MQERVLLSPSRYSATLHRWLHTTERSKSRWTDQGSPAVSGLPALPFQLDCPSSCTLTSATHLSIYMPSYLLINSPFYPPFYRHYKNKSLSTPKYESRKFSPIPLPIQTSLSTFLRSEHVLQIKSRKQGACISHSCRKVMRIKEK